MEVVKKFEKEGVKVFKNVKETGRELGRGSYGTVVELTVNDEGKFAGKIIHKALISEKSYTLMANECKIMSELEHPNIVRFCGVCSLSSSTIPALVMELMHRSLEDAIDDKATRLEYKTALSIFIDIANGLAYLHCRTPRVFHRDLTSRNVLLDRQNNAKITDFGNSKIIDLTKVNATMTKVPGTPAYMPPEAFSDTPKYTDRLDVFSFGHLALYTLILEFPGALLEKQHISEGRLVPRSEVERRRQYMDTLNVILPTRNHHLYQLIEQCLHNEPTKRPSATELLFWLQEILRLEQRDFEESTTGDYMDIHPGATKAEKVATALKQMQAYLNKRPANVAEEHEKKIPERTKMGLIEKKSVRMLKEGWRAYQFTLDYNSSTFQYSRMNPFGPSTQLRLDNITEVKELDPEGSTFPFEVHFKGKNSPWVLRSYSESDRSNWTKALLLQPSGTLSQLGAHIPQAEEDGREEEAQLPVSENDDAISPESPDPVTSGQDHDNEQLQKIIHDLQERVEVLEGEREYSPDDSRYVYVVIPEHAPAQSSQYTLHPPAVKVIPPSPAPQRDDTKPAKKLQYVSVKPVPLEDARGGGAGSKPPLVSPPQYRSHSLNLGQDLPVIRRPKSASYEHLTETDLLPEKHNSHKRLQQRLSLPVEVDSLYEAIDSMQSAHPIGFSPEMPPHPLDEPIYSDPSESTEHEKTKDDPPVKPKPRVKPPSPTNPSKHSIGGAKLSPQVSPKPRQRHKLPLPETNLAQIPTPIPEELQYMFWSVQKGEDDDECIYEKVDTECYEDLPVTRRPKSASYENLTETDLLPEKHNSHKRLQPMLSLPVEVDSLYDSMQSAHPMRFSPEMPPHPLDEPIYPSESTEHEKPKDDSAVKPKPRVKRPTSPTNPSKRSIGGAKLSPQVSPKPRQRHKLPLPPSPETHLPQIPNSPVTREKLQYSVQKGEEGNESIYEVIDAEDLIKPKPRVRRPPSPTNSLKLSTKLSPQVSPKPRHRHKLPLPPSPETHLPQIPNSPVTREKLQNMLRSVQKQKGEEDDESIYEVIDPEDLQVVSEPMAPPLPQPKPPRRVMFAVREGERQKQTDTCTTLEDLQEKALSISLSSLSGQTKIGKGHFGQVYRANLGKQIVALKVVGKYSSQEVMDQFENEMSTISQVCHPNIVQVYGILREGPLSPALVMEFLPHGDLKTFLGKEKQPTEFLLKCMSDVAMGMHYLSGRGLIHRDLAARNILLDKNKTCKVSDFGLLREIPKDDSLYISQTDLPFPLRWMAPESISNHTFSSASDVWSYGILQWEMFFPDQEPYHDMEITQMVANVTSGYRMPIPEECPMVAREIMKACWRNDPRERPAFLLISNLLLRRDRLHC